jgi:hypothetical protein
LLRCEQTGGDKGERVQGVGVSDPKAPERSWHPMIKRAHFSDENESGIQAANAMLIAVEEWPRRFAAVHE